MIKSVHTGKLIGVNNNTNDRNEQLDQWNDNQNQLCHHQWYFVPLQGQEKDRVYIIQSIYNRKVFDVSRGNVSNGNRVQQSDMVMNDVNQQFRLIAVSNEDSCLIQSLATGKVLDAKTQEFITQVDLNMNINELVIDRNKRLWQLIPFNINKG